MSFATYELINTELIPAIVSINGESTPVWHQAKWSEGEYEEFVRKNGCGHCCAAMALNLHGVKINPHEEFALCRKLWGEPDREREFPQGTYQTVSGISKILRHHGVPAECFGVPTREQAARHISEVLRAMITPAKSSSAARLLNGKNSFWCSCYCLSHLSQSDSI